jgi:hypothetical protein
MSGVIPGFEAGTTSPNTNMVIPLSAGAVPSTNYTAWDQSQLHPVYTFTKTQDAYAGGWPSEVISSNLLHTHWLIDQSRCNPTD